MAFRCARLCRLGLASVLSACLLACGGGGGGGDDPEPPTPAPNRAPVFTSAASTSVAEDTAAVFYTAVATDPDGDALSYSLSGGSDAAAFRITSAGALSFVAAPDFETPADSNRDNVYQVQIAASDGRASASLMLSVTVTDVPSVAFRVRRVAAGYDFPIFIAPVPDSSGRMFVVEREGRIRILDPRTGNTAPLPFLDITGQISTDGERGLLGFATAPDFPTSGVFYVFATDPQGTLEIRRYRTLAVDRDRADPASNDVIVRIPHPRFANHNGGWIAFGPDSLLYIATGDGGGAGDPDNNAQNTTRLLGKMLRIDPSQDAFPADPSRDYAIPSGNPFASTGGAPEVWTYGLRNPFRNSFDPVTGYLLIGDVGQGAREEIDLMRASDGGANFGWPIMEGTQVFDGPAQAGLTPPVTEYAHGTGPLQGRTVIGGHVYRGPVESLRGHYFFADFITPNLWSVPLSALQLGQTLPATAYTRRNAAFAPDAGTYDNIVSFGVDQAGNLYIVDFDGEIFVVEAAP